jgi:Outer membrane protein beta-barrel domain
MKTKKILILILSGLSFFVQAQSFYVRGGLGGAICSAPHMDYQYSDNDHNGYQETIEAKRAGLGDGLPIFAAAGYYFGKNLGVELGVNYFYGLPNKIVNTRAGLSTTSKTTGSMLALLPAFIMKFDLGKCKPYARLGLIIGVLNTAKTVIKTSGSSDTLEKVDATIKYYGGIAIGAQAALGVEYPMSKMLSLFGEVNLNGINWAPKKGKFTQYSVNGVDELGNMQEIVKSWDYEKKIDLGEPFSLDQPGKRESINYSFANVGLIVGVKINFGK